MTDRITLTVPVVKVLAALLATPDTDRYGLDLMKATGLPSGTLYPVLVRLANAGWVVTRWEELDPVAAGRPARRYYRLSPEGGAQARAQLAELRGHLDRPPRPAARSRRARPAAGETSPAW